MCPGTGLMNSNVVDVGIGAIEVCRAPNILRTVLGSCVALCLFDPEHRIAGLAHIVLPHYNGKDEPSRFADTGYGLLVDALRAYGARRDRLVARIAGGARMSIVKEDSPFATIGEKSALVIRELLKRDCIPVLSEQIGGSLGLSVLFSAQDGEITIRELPPAL